jgi:hypothetical protein
MFIFKGTVFAVQRQSVPRSPARQQGARESIPSGEVSALQILSGGARDVFRGEAVVVHEGLGGKLDRPQTVVNIPPIPPAIDLHRCSLKLSAIFRITPDLCSATALSTYAVHTSFLRSRMLRGSESHLPLTLKGTV